MGGGLQGEGAVYCVPDAQAAAKLLAALLRAGDTVLVKGSRGMGLEQSPALLAAIRHRRAPEP